MPVPELTVDIWVGTLWKPVITVLNETGNPTDPASITCTLRKPDDSEEPSTLTKVGVGEYQASVQITTSGPWELIPQSTNPTAPGKLVANAVNP